MNDSQEIEQLTRALAAGDNDARSWGRLGTLQARRGQWQAAAAAFERAIALDPYALPAYQGLARARFALQDLDAVENIVNALQEQMPEAAFTHLLAGHLHKAMGDASLAAAAYRQALEYESTLGEALFGLVDLKAPPPDSQIASLATQAATREDLSSADRINAHFALGRIHDRVGAHETAFSHYASANEMAREELARQGIQYHRGRRETRVAEILADYPASSFRTPLAPLPIDLSPIFIIGLPRSGTTLLEQILAAHPEVQTGGELNAAHECEARFRAERHQAGRSGPVDPANHEDAALLEAARERYVERLFEQALDASRVVDKMPANFELAGFLRLMFPDAVIIHSMRDVRASAWSLYSANFAGHEPYYHDLDDLAHYIGQYQRLMQHWREVMPPPYLEIAYEDLVREPEARIPALLEAAGLEPHPNCLAFHEQARPVFTASHAQVRQPIHRQAIDHWRHYERWLGPINQL